MRDGLDVGADCRWANFRCVGFASGTRNIQVFKTVSVGAAGVEDEDHVIAALTVHAIRTRRDEGEGTGETFENR